MLARARMCTRQVESKWFDPVILATIGANCVTLAWQSPLDPSGTLKEVSRREPPSDACAAHAACVRPVHAAATARVQLFSAPVLALLSCRLIAAAA